MLADVLSLVGFVPAPYAGESCVRQLGDAETDGAVYVEDLGHGRFSIATYHPAGTQRFFGIYTNLSEIIGIAVCQVAAYVAPPSRQSPV